MKGFRLPPRNPRTNPFGKYVTGYFNFRTEMFPLAPVEERSSTWARAIPIYAFFGGMFFGGYYLYGNHTESQLWQVEQLSAAHQTDACGAHVNLNYPQEAKPHYEPIPPLRNFSAVRPDMVFGGNGAFKPHEDGHGNVISQLRNKHEASNSLLFQYGHNWNVHRYTKAKPADEYDAIRLKALFNLAAAAYHEGRRPAFHLPLAVQNRLAQHKQQNVMDPALLQFTTNEAALSRSKIEHIADKKSKEISAANFATFSKQLQSYAATLESQ